ncbi:MAG: SpoIIE family protein phosphatase, partial [Candidatus Eremiobacteraeota bacterium]|nr:SpoIIE family protein phosphatase [Candidatus Eremiobacteraeota bacterium]
ALLTPLIIQDQVIGIIRVVNKKGGKELFTREDSDAMSALARSASLAVHNARLFDELSRSGRLLREVDFALKLQKSILPERLPGGPTLQAGAFIETAHELTTEFYDCIKLGDGKYLFALGRVGGRTFSAAIFMGIAQAMLRSLAMTCDSFKMIAELTNEYLPKTIRGRTSSVQASFLLVDRDNRRIEYINAGLPPPLILKGRRLGFLLSRGLPLGEFRSSHYEPETVPLKSNCTIMIYTEGISRARDSNDEPFGISRLARFLRRKRELPASKIIEDLRKEIFLYLGSEPQLEDMAALVVKIP